VSLFVLSKRTAIS